MGTRSRVEIISNTLSVIPEDIGLDISDISNLTNLDSELIPQYVEMLDDEDFLKSFDRSSDNKNRYTLTEKGKKLRKLLDTSGNQA